VREHGGRFGVMELRSNGECCLQTRTPAPTDGGHVSRRRGTLMLNLCLVDVPARALRIRHQTR
jgi:hypothetical protein